MNSEEKLAQIFKQYQEAGKTNKNVDVASLILQALDRQNKNQLSNKQKRWAYIASLALPPFGLLFALKFFISDSDKTDAKQVAYICILLTVVSIVVGALLLNTILSTSGVSVDQIEQIRSEDIQQLLQ